jgi:hypothetical protein
MSFVARFALLAGCLLTAAGCASFCHHDDCECPEPKRGSEEWWAMQAQSPVGARQFEKKGKYWPPYPRPTGPVQQFTHRYHAAHYWPWPYNCTDRQYVLDLAQIQEANGWLTETTLYDYHFNGDSNELTVPGKLHLQWILENVPPAYRAVWLEQADDPAVSQQRLNNVRTVAARYVGDANLPPIALRIATPPARPAIEVDMIRRKELESIPVPRIPAEEGSGVPAPTGT